MQYLMEEKYQMLTATNILNGKGTLLEKKNRYVQCCFTGHRPEKLERSPREIQEALESEIQSAIRDGFIIFITGMARGVDLWAGMQVLSLRKRLSFLKLFCAVPFEGIERKWPEKWRKLYWQVLKESDGGKVFYPSYQYVSFMERNRYMVDYSARVIAVSNGALGGTYNTIEYARKQKIDVRFILA